MNTGKIKNTSDKGFGFIETSNGDLFFHHSQYNGQFEELRKGQSVTYEVGEGRKGPCAENVQLVDPS